MDLASVPKKTEISHLGRGHYIKASICDSQFVKRQFIYLHGFASSPQSFKAQYFVQKFEGTEHSLKVPDFNQDNFYGLTLTRQIQQIQSLLLPQKRPTTLIGSSFGGLTAAWVAERSQLIDQLVLLAPAFGFIHYWQSVIGTSRLQTWQQKGDIEVYHYGYQQDLKLSYSFIQDLEQYDEEQLQRSIPTLIIHGRNDQVIPICASQKFAQDRPWVNLHEVDSDHGLGNAVEEAWQLMLEFCEISKELS